MKTRFWAALLLLCLTAPAYAVHETSPRAPSGLGRSDNTPVISSEGEDGVEKSVFRKRFSLELGAGPGPLHMLVPDVSPTWAQKRALAQEGLEANDYDALYPAFSLSGVWRYAYRWELALTGGISWSHYKVTRYEQFGVDPQGQPRYDLTQGSPAGWRNSSPVGSLTCQWRVFWNPAWTVQPYSAFGFGFSTASSIIPLPSLTPVGLRYGGDHFYFFAETPLNPVALFLHVGAGYRF